MIYSEFKRKFSMAMYKNLKIKLGEMNFTKDFVNDIHGNLYPVIHKSINCIETVEDNFYILTSGEVKRIFCQFFPYATYKLTAKITEGNVGFSFQLPNVLAEISINENKLVYSCEDNIKKVDLPDNEEGEYTLIISCRPKAFDVYFKNNGKPEYFCTFYEELFENSNDYSMISNGYVLLSVSNNVTVKEVVS